MAYVQIFNDDKWQVQHWRTLVSVYKQTPYWEYYEQDLQNFYNTPFNNLTDFNKASFLWICKQLKMNISIEETNSYLAQYPDTIIDLRSLKPSKEQKLLARFPTYYQVFADRVGFLPNLSILDLLFSEGPHTANWLKTNKTVLTSSDGNSI